MSKPSCSARSESKAVQNHIHTCNGHHDDDMHFCAVCRRHWWVKPAKENKGG